MQQERRGLKFTPRAIRALHEDGVAIYTADPSVTRARGAKKHLPYKYLPNICVLGTTAGSHNFQPPRYYDFALYPSPDMVFLSGTRDQDLRTQQMITDQSARSLRNRLGIEEIDLAIVNHHLIAQLIAVHLQEKGRLLFGEANADRCGLNDFYNDPTERLTESLGLFAVTADRMLVGSRSLLTISEEGPDPELGTAVYQQWIENGHHPRVGVLRVVVPRPINT